MAHHEVNDALVEKIKNRVYNEGMGFIGMHSAHMSKPFRAIVGTSGQLSWGDDQQEIVWNLLPQHPIAAGIPEYFELEVEEMYGEPFRIPQRTSLSSQAGIRAETSSEAVLHITAESERYSTSSPVMRPAAPSTILMSREFSPTRFTGQSRTIL